MFKIRSTCNFDFLEIIFSYDSYEKSYLVLLDDMIKGDLALIGSINGVELLIFPSNQLPEKSNRKNNHLFLINTCTCAYL